MLTSRHVTQDPFSTSRQPELTGIHGHPMAAVGHAVFRLHTPGRGAPACWLKVMQGQQYTVECRAELRRPTV